MGATTIQLAKDESMIVSIVASLITLMTFATTAVLFASVKIKSIVAASKSSAYV